MTHSTPPQDIRGGEDLENLQVEIMGTTMSSEVLDFSQLSAMANSGWPGMALLGAAPAAAAGLLLFLLLRRRLGKNAREIPSTVVPPSGEFDYIIVGGGLAGSVLTARDEFNRTFFGLKRGLIFYFPAETPPN